MIKNLGNYKHLIKPEWLEFWTNKYGQLLPDNRECMLPDFHPQNKDIANSWDFTRGGQWHQFEIPDMDFTLPWPVKLSNNYDWWVIKMYPGQCMPLHYDPCEPETTKRYMMALQDYEPGHVLIWNDELVRDYKMGDLIEFTDVLSWHGAANFSNNLRLMAYLSVFDLE